MNALLRGLLVAVVLALVVGVLVGLHLWVIERLVIAPGWWFPGAEVMLCAASIGVMVLALVAERLVPPPWLRAVTVPGYVWMGFALLVIVATAASDLVMWPLGLLDDVEAARWRALGVLGISALAGARGLVNALRPRVREVEIELDRWPHALDDVRIVQISDLHIGPILGRAWAERLVERVQALSPDLIVVTGDLIDGLVPKVGPQTEPLSALSAPHGVFAITGNHEMFCGPNPWVAHYRDALGMRVLCNERVEVTAHGEVFDLAGTHDRTGKHFGCAEDLEAVLTGRPDPARPIVLLAHDPLSFKRASSMGVDLQLSGHTHGGQIWPLHVFVRLVIPFVSGHHRRGDSQLYVHRGTGFWGPPMRLLAPAEIAVVRLRATL